MQDQRFNQSLAPHIRNKWNRKSSGLCDCCYSTVLVMRRSTVLPFPSPLLRGEKSSSQVCKALADSCVFMQFIYMVLLLNEMFTGSPIILMQISHDNPLTIIHFPILFQHHRNNLLIVFNRYGFIVLNAFTKPRPIEICTAFHIFTVTYSIRCFGYFMWFCRIYFITTFIKFSIKYFS